MKDTLVDKNGRIAGAIDVALNENSVWVGVIDNSSMPTDIAMVFSEFASDVNDNVLSTMRRHEERIESFGFRLGSSGAIVDDLQIFDGVNISFRTGMAEYVRDDVGRT